MNKNRIIHTLSTSRTALILLLATLLTATAAQTAGAQDAISGLTYNSTGGYYEISDAQDLVDLATYVNGGNNASGKTFKQTKDITLTEAVAPIGNSSSKVFMGTYDGGNYTISGLNVSSITEDGFTCSGLFGRVQGANLHDIVLISPIVSTSVANDMNTYVGPIVAFTKESSTQVSNCTVINPTVTLPDGFTGNAGAIVGKIYDGRFSNCHFYGGNQNEAIGYNFGNTVTNVSRVYTLTATGCTATATATVTVGTTSYYNSGTAVSLGHAAPPAGYLFSDYSSDDVTITDGAFTMPAADVAVAATFTPDPAHFSQDGDTYTIKTTDGWNVFCDLLADNTMGYFSGKTVVLANDITVTRMAGGENHAFTGTFDGGGHTLTVNYANTDNDTMTAPFSYVDGATIQNLIVGGTISGTAYRAAGIIGETVNTTSHITNCVSNVDISSGRYTGGFSIGGNVEIEGCVFNGKINGYTYSGGFIGYSYSAQVIKNSLFAPQDGSSISGGTFYYNGGGDVAPVNSYYTQALGTAQGKACHSVTAGTDVTIGAIALTGTPTQYTVSGITAYSGGGLQRGETLYYGSDDQLALTLSNSVTGAPQGYQYGYTASAGTLSGSTLTMPDENVTISVNTADLAPIDWATVNQGNPADPYMIYNKDQLLLLAHRVNGTNGETANDYKGKYFKLGADITFSHPDNEGNDYAENYEAIGGYLGGYTYRHFRGNFNGDNKTVSGIRIRKTGDGDADSYQGLFGMISGGGTIHDVHLTDARIKSYYYVGGIVGYNSSCTVSGCTVTDSYITATKEPTNNYGTICGYTNYTDRLTNNYYHGCTVNGTAVTSGKGCQGADIAANHGALPAYAITLGANITTPPGTFVGQTGWLDTPPVGARLAPENGFTLAGNLYFASGYVFTPGSTLASGAAQGYTPRATLGGQLLDLYTPTGNDDLLAGKAIARLSITADCDGKTLASTQAIYSTGRPVTVAYINADGTPGEASAIALDGTETSLAAGWYFVGKNISYNATLTLSGNVNLILADGCEMKVGESGAPIEVAYSAAIDGYVNNGEEVLTIYGQTLGTGTLKAYASGNGYIAIHADALTVNGGNITAGADGEYATAIYTQGDININRGTVTATATATESFGIYAYNGTVNINGGTVTANGTENSIYGNAVNINGGIITANGGGIYIDSKNGDVAINGGNVTASSIYSESGNITLGWTRPADRITASSISTGGGTVAVADGQALTDGSGNIYTGTLTASVLSGFAAETTLQPCLVLNETDGVTPLAALAGQANVPVIFTRSGLTANAYSTMCLPFGFEKPSDCTFYAFKGVGWSTANNQWEATISETSTLAAHTPYIFKCSDTEATFIGTIASVPSDISNSLVEVGASEGDDKEWKFKGTYTALDWTSADPTEPTYGFSTYVPEQTIAAGTFVRFVQGASLAPFRARLIYSGSNEHLNARSHSRAAQAEGELPRYIIVRIIGADGTATAIGTLDTTTGQLSTDGWYTLGGRRLEAKPTAKGIYIHNGRKVIVK